MNIIKAFKRFTGLDQNQQAYLTRQVAIYDDAGETSSGTVVNIWMGMHNAAIFTAIKRIADAVASTPLGVFEYLAAGGRQKATDHPVYNVLNVQANQDSTAYTWKHVTTTHLCGWGNAYSLINLDNGGRIVGLTPMHPGDVKIEPLRDEQGNLVYSWTNKNQQKFLFPATSILHIKGVSVDGINGLSPIWQLRQLVGRMVTREEYISRFYANGAMLGGVISAPGTLTEEQSKRARESFDQMYRGARNSGKILLLEGGGKFDPIGISPRDAEFINTAKIDAGSVAAVFGVPSQLLNETESVNRASAEQIFREFLALGLNTVFCNIESQVNVSLFSPSERQQFYSEFNRESLITTDFAAKIAGLKDEVLTAMMTPNEARGLLNLPPKPGGDSLLAPVNMVPIGQLGQTTAFQQPGAPKELPEPEQKALPPVTRTLDPTAARKRSRAAKLTIIKASKPNLQSAFDRIGQREQADIGAAAKKNLRDADSFNSYLQNYYAPGSSFNQFFQKLMKPNINSMSTSVHGQVSDQLDKDIPSDSTDFEQSYLDNLAWRYTSSSQRQLASLLADLGPEDDPMDAVANRLAQWDDGTTDVNPTRAEKAATNEASRYVNAAARFFMAAGGVTRLVWSGGDCPLCQEMDGKTAGIEDDFVSKGDTVGDMTVQSNFSNPPLHQGCDCTVDPA